MLRAPTRAAISATLSTSAGLSTRKAILFSYVGGRFCDTEEFRGHIARGLELQPSFDGHFARKPQGREQRFVKANYLGESRHTQINVIEMPLHNYPQFILN
jgi:hypothetical protein